MAKKKTVKKKVKKFQLEAGEGTYPTGPPTKKQPKPKKMGTGDALRRVSLDVASCVIPIASALMGAGCKQAIPQGLKLTEEVIENLGLKEGVHMRDGCFVANLVSSPAMREIAEKLDVRVKFDEKAWKTIYPKR